MPRVLVVELADGSDPDDFRVAVRAVTDLLPRDVVQQVRAFVSVAADRVLCAAADWSERHTGFAHGGWYFARDPDGAVRVTVFDGPATSGSPVVAQVVLAPDEWGSVVARVSASGENADTVRQADEIHQCRLPPK